MVYRSPQHNKRQVFKAIRTIVTSTNSESETESGSGSKRLQA